MKMQFAQLLLNSRMHTKIRQGYKKMLYLEEGSHAGEEETTNEGDRVTHRDKTKSVIWVHFCINKDRKNICVYCQHAVAARDGNNSNLFLHLRTKHPSKYNVAVKARKATEERKGKRSTSTSTSTMDVKE